MDALVIKGPVQINGKVAVNGSKNSALPLLFASLIFDQEIHFENVPRLWDIETTLKLLNSMGVQSEWDREAGRISLVPWVLKKVAPYEWVSKMRAGILALGPLVAKYGEAYVSLPGGCAIGARPVNFHTESLKKMGAIVEVEHGYIKATAPKRLQGTEIEFPQVSVTGTENLLVVAALAEGTTVLKNAAREPEVTALGENLIKWGADIQGLGTNEITIKGKTKLTPPTDPIRIPPDRVETGTWIAAAAATKSDLTIENCDPSEMGSVLAAFREMGVQIDETPNSLRVRTNGPLKAIDLETAPYPGFPTDMQAQILTTLCIAEGESSIRETIFENRFMHVAELQRLGAKIKVRGNLAKITGGGPLRGAPIMATDLRASASLVIAALCAEGMTKISRIYHLDRGYQRLDEKLQRLGVEVTRISE